MLRGLPFSVRVSSLVRDDSCLCVCCDAQVSKAGGTLVYAAPEVFSGRVGKAADVYSLGIILWEMVTGSQPYKDLAEGERTLDTAWNSQDARSFAHDHAHALHTPLRCTTQLVRMRAPGPVKGGAGEPADAFMTSNT